MFKMCLQIIYLIYNYKPDLALNNFQWLICRKTKPNQTKPITNKRRVWSLHLQIKFAIIDFCAWLFDKIFLRSTSTNYVAVVKDFIGKRYHYNHQGSWQHGFLWLPLAFLPNYQSYSFRRRPALMNVSHYCWANSGVSLHWSPWENVTHGLGLGLWVNPYFPISVQLIFLAWFARWEVSGHTATVLWGASWRMCSKQQSAPFSSSYLAFFPNASLRWCNHAIVQTKLQLRRIPVFTNWVWKIATGEMFQTPKLSS